MTEPIVFGQAFTRRVRIDHRIEGTVPPAWEPSGDRRCSTCNIPVRWVFRQTLGYGWWAHVPLGRVVVPG